MEQENTEKGSAMRRGHREYREKTESMEGEFSLQCLLQRTSRATGHPDATPASECNPSSESYAWAFGFGVSSGTIRMSFSDTTTPSLAAAVPPRGTIFMPRLLVDICTYSTACSPCTLPSRA